jgi:Predicted 3'-5' exonuclease related to the exonuclease domain of PolB
MKPSVIVWDLETVPDLAGFAAANDLVGKSDVEVREAIGDKFPKHIYHSIVCIGALIAHWELDHWAVDAVGAPHVGDRTEKELITAFCDKIAELSPQLVTFTASPSAAVAVGHFSLVPGCLFHLAWARIVVGWLIHYVRWLIHHIWYVPRFRRGIQLYHW